MPSIYVIDQPSGAQQTFDKPLDMLPLMCSGAPIGSTYSMWVDGDKTKVVPIYVHTDAGWQPYEPPLGEQQTLAYSYAMDGGNCFITGPGGVGKSEVVRRIIRDLRRQGRKVAVTASTGVAAANIRGMTIHSTLGTGISGNRVAQQKRYTGEAAAKCERRLGDIDTIVLDEVSMLTGDYLDMMDWWLRLILGEDKPFAGKQMVFVGDFLQLPPVIQGTDKVNRHFAFQSNIWLDAPPEVFYLRKGYRQDDAEFRKHLMRVRRGLSPEDTLDYFNARRAAAFPAGVKPTRLMSLNREVNSINQREIAKIAGPESCFTAQFFGNENWIEALKKNLPCEEVLELKVGAEVVFTKNNKDQRYVNGTRGVIEELDGRIVVRGRDGDAYEAVRESWSLVNADDVELASVTQFPLRLAWAMTIHKAQGSTLDDLELSPSSIFEKGQCYVALSRVRSIAGLRLAGRLEARHVMAHEDVVDWYAQALEAERARAGVA